MKRCFAPFLALVLVLSIGFSEAYAAKPVDNDGDGYKSNVDCDDNNPDINPGAAEICTDGIDNDCDGFIDGVDPDCGGGCTPTESPEVSCTDGIDNDCDGLTDSADPDCATGGPCSSYADKGSCNADPNCEWVGSPKNGSCQDVSCTVTENPEVSCTDGIDNDCDGLTDSADPDCDPGCTVTENPEVSCTDAIDNDCDGLVDSADPDCPTGACTPTPNHDGLLFADYPNNCLSCHNAQANDMAGAVHYRWLGDTPEMVNQGGTQQGKLTNAVNSYCINIAQDWAICGKCHVGRGLSPDDPAADNTNIDCLMCHNEEYAMARDRIGSGAGSMTVATPNDCMVQEVHKPTRANCLKCHANAGGGDAVKRGDLSMATITNSDPHFDVHMNTAGANLACQDCHTYSNHKVTGKGSDLRPTDLASEVSCSTSTCHVGWDSGTGHASGGAARGEGDRHVFRVKCQSCHVDVYAKQATEMHRDWQTKHDATDASTCDASNPCPGHPHSDKASNVTPEFLFWNRLSDNYLLGDDASLTYDAVKNTYPTSRPLGDITDGMLTPFKYKTATQPIADATNQLIPLDTYIYLHGSQTGNSDEATLSGMAYLGVGGTYSWVDTDTHQMINHGVAPAASVDCSKCHPSGNLDPTTDSMLDALGYKLKDAASLICNQCHRVKSPKGHESMHNHLNKGSGIGCYFCHDVARPERGLCSPCDPACVSEFVDSNPYPHACPEPPY